MPELHKVAKPFARIALVSVVLWGLFFLLAANGNMQANVPHPVAALFFGGLVQAIMGLSCVVRNGGLFKSLSYVGYVIKKSKINKDIVEGLRPKSEKPEPFAEYVLNKYNDRWNSTPYFVGATAMFALYGLIYALID